MEKFNFLKIKSVPRLSKTPGVYAFKKGKEFLYIGKAINIQERIKSHFKKNNYKDNLFIDKVNKIGYIKTDSEIESLILEAGLIKRYLPKYNIVWRDDKNFFFVGITKSDLPRVFITHQPKIENTKYKTLHTEFIGPFVSGTSLKKALKTLRKVFPYYTVKKHPRVPCSWCSLGLCPGPDPDKREYLKNIKNLILVLKGKKKSVLKNLKKEMRLFSEKQNYEKAAEIRDKIKALEKVLSHAQVFEKIKLKTEEWEKPEKELRKILKTKNGISRIEAYDISNIQGQKATGSMVTFIRGKPTKNFYRKFKIRISGKPNDIAMIKEVLTRRLKHLEWGLPDLILIDGGLAQLNAAVKVKNQEWQASSFPPHSLRSNDKEECSSDWFRKVSQFKRIKNIRVLAIAKRKNKLYIENRKKPLLLKNFSREVFNLILQLRDEAHRFALLYHRKLMKKDLLPNPSRRFVPTS